MAAIPDERRGAIVWNARSVCWSSVSIGFGRERKYADTAETIGMELIAVAAVAENGVIGKDGEIPWVSIPEDKRQYRGRIEEWPVILGRKTFDSMREDLPGSVQIVLSRTESDFGVESARHASSVEEAIALLEQMDTDRAYVIGGGGIYALFQPVVDRMVLSRIPGEYDGDSYFPEWDSDEWNLLERTEYEEFVLEEWSRVSD